MHHLPGAAVAKVHPGSYTAAQHALQTDGSPFPRHLASLGASLGRPAADRQLRWADKDRNLKSPRRHATAALPLRGVRRRVRTGRVGNPAAPRQHVDHLLSTARHPHLQPGARHVIQRPRQRRHLDLRRRAGHRESCRAQPYCRGNLRKREAAPPQRTPTMQRRLRPAPTV